MLIDNPKGGFSFVKGIGPFSSGAVANDGFEIVHAVALPLIKLDDGYGVIERHMREAGRPMNAVCGMELRIPKPLTPAGFNEFNQGYLKHLAGWDVQVDGNNPIARTNVAIAIAPVAEPALFGFYYTVPSTTTVAHLRAGGRGRSEIDERAAKWKSSRAPMYRHRASRRKPNSCWTASASISPK